MRTLLLASLLFAGHFVSLSAVPVPDPISYHAFCRTLWLFATPCADISAKILQQIQVRPEYMLVSATFPFIKANHSSLDIPEGQNITFAFSATVLTAGCRVSAQSTSVGFTSLLDGGLNYCNLYNLLSGSGLNSDPSFMETTNEWACLGYGLATCIA